MMRKVGMKCGLNDDKLFGKSVCQCIVLDENVKYDEALWPNG